MEIEYDGKKKMVRYGMTEEIPRCFYLVFFRKNSFVPIFSIFRRIDVSDLLLDGSHVFQKDWLPVPEALKTGKER